MNNVKKSIGWADYTCNCFWGCLNGCSYCAAFSMARRFGKYIGEKRGYSQEIIHKMSTFQPVFLTDQLSLIKKIKKPSRIFMSFMGEPFAPEFEDCLPIAFRTIKAFPEHTFLMLTKQPQNLIKWSPFPENCWVGVSCTNHRQFHDASHYLKQIKAKVRFYSFEPLLEHINLTAPNPYYMGDWTICGAQTLYSPKTAPQISWVKEIVLAADKAKIPVFLKNNLKSIIETEGFIKGEWAAREWVQCKYPVLRQEFPALKGK